MTHPLTTLARFHASNARYRYDVKVPDGWVTVEANNRPQAARIARTNGYNVLKVSDYYVKLRSA
jgi:hypothetical protein